MSSNSSSHNEKGQGNTASLEEEGNLSKGAKDFISQTPPAFKWSSLWSQPTINHLNGKSQTLPILNLNNPYSRNFHLAWLGFFVAFLSWFAFPPLLPEAIKADLKLTPAQIGNSNIVALTATLLVRLIAGPFVDRYGPRKVMAGILIAGAIPSGLAGTISNANGLYVIRFFIGILGGTFVPCLAWTTAFYDKNVVGTANAFVGGWGNTGGGVTFVVMVSLFQSLVTERGLSSHSAWRASYAVVPVPILLFTAIITLIYGTDSPAGPWHMRHTLPASAIAARQGHLATLDPEERRIVEDKEAGKSQAKVSVVPVDEDEVVEKQADIDIAVAEHLTFKTALKIAISPYTALPALMYMTTFGFELAVDANLANVFFNSHAKLGQLNAGYYASIFGFLNVVTRPLGGYVGDVMGRRFGTRGKKYITIAFGFLQGAMSLALGLYQRSEYNAGRVPVLGVQIGLVILMAIWCEMANGSNFSLVPHCNSFNNGVMSGLVGGFGNLGGIFFALMFRFHSTRAFTDAWWIAGAFAMGVNLLCVFIPAPKN